MLPMVIRKMRGRLSKKIYRSGWMQRQITRHFHRAFYYSRDTWRNTSWFGHALLKCPLDLWIYQELLHELRPEVIVETGTYLGGSAMYFANLCDLLGEGRIITIDIEDRPDRPQHPRVQYFTGSSIADDMIERVREDIGEARCVLVVLDSDHSRAHVLEELRRYREFVTPRSYLIVEDSSVNGHPVQPLYGPGPMEAISTFLRECPDFESDPTREKYFMTFNPRGYLKRIS